MVIIGGHFLSHSCLQHGTSLGHLLELPVLLYYYLGKDCIFVIVDRKSPFIFVCNQWLRKNKSILFYSVLFYSILLFYSRLCHRSASRACRPHGPTMTPAWPSSPCGAAAPRGGAQRREPPSAWSTARPSCRPPWRGPRAQRARRGKREERRPGRLSGLWTCRAQFSSPM